MAEVHSRLIGDGTSIWQYTVILDGARIGCGCNINCHVFIESDVIVGDQVTVKSGVQLWNGVRLGNRVFIGPNATFTNDHRPRSKQYPESFAETVVADGASIGANATILSGVRIGAWAMIGAGSVVTRDVPAFALWYGNPARPKGYVTRTGDVISLKLKDKSGRTYVLVDGEPVPND